MRPLYNLKAKYAQLRRHKLHRYYLYHISHLPVKKNPLIIYYWHTHTLKSPELTGDFDPYDVDGSKLADVKYANNYFRITKSVRQNKDRDIL